MYVLRSRRKLRTPHNFARGKSTTRSKPLAKVNHSNRLVRKYRNRKAPGTILSETRNEYDNYASDDAKPKNKNTSKKSTASKFTFPADHLEDKNERPSGDVTAVPNPIPDAGFQPTKAQVLGNQLATILPASSGRAALINSPTAGSSTPFTTLSPLMPLVSSTTFSVASALPLPTLSPSAGPNRWNSTGNATGMRPKPLLSTPVIVLLAVGAGLFLAGVFIVIKICSRPTRRPRPTPSLPILQDSFSDSSSRTEKESPIFGGKEISSSQPGSNAALWAWTQYPQSGSALSQSAQAPTYGRLRTDAVCGYGSVSLSPRLQGIPSYSGNSWRNQYTGHAHTHSAPVLSPRNSPYQPPLQQVQSAVARAAGRLSSSLYLDSAQSTSCEDGLALDLSGQGTMFTADGLHVIERTKSKATLQRRGSSATETKEQKNDGLTQGLAYDGADVSSPRFLPYTMPEPVAPTPSRGGRTRIKSSYYTPGPYPRTSHLPMIASKADIHSLPFEPLHNLSISKSEPRRERDTQALTAALGLVSPTTEYVMPSPQPSLYPDDSLSVVEAKKPHKRSHKKLSSNRTSVTDITEDRPSLPMIPPVMDASAALGSLMLMDFGATSKSLATLGAQSGENSKPQLDVPQNLRETNKVGGNSSKVPGASSKQSILRSDDKPPHIPLPPPLPSLTQMGLEHANPAAYADYRSPTYSIYGLYESECKSGFGY